MLLLGFCALALSFFVTALATALWMLIVVRLFSGAMQSNVSVANAYVADITPPDERAKRFGLLGAMFGLGFILGPVMGGLLGAIDLHLPFFAAGVLSLINLLYGYFVLPESLPPERRRPLDWKTALNPVTSFARARPAARRRPAGRGDRLHRAGAVHPLHQLGALHHASSSAGGRCRTAGRCSPSAWSRRWSRACCSAGC